MPCRKKRLRPHPKVQTQSGSYSPKVDISESYFNRQFLTMDPTQVVKNGCVCHTHVRAQLLQYAFGFIRMSEPNGENAKGNED